MPSSPDLTPTAPGGAAGSWKRWNRRLHYFLGLYLLFFIWLFALTGLVLNHSSWKIFQLTRTPAGTDRSIQAPAVTNPLGQAKDLMDQLGIVGEIDSITTRPGQEQLDFRVVTPARLIDVKADLRNGRATVQRAENNAGGTFQLLHTFTGVRQGDPAKSRDWILTSVWAFCMDAVSVGLAVLVFGGLCMWYELAAKRVPGLIALGLGLIACGWFVAGLKWLHG